MLALCDGLRCSGRSANATYEWASDGIFIIHFCIALHFLIAVRRFANSSEVKVHLFPLQERQGRLCSRQNGVLGMFT